MDEALYELEKFIRAKAVSSTKSITEHMQKLCHTAAFTDRGAQQDFAQKCSKFDRFSQSVGKEHWGKKQFEQWWNEGAVTPDREVYCTPNTGKFPTLPRAVPPFMEDYNPPGSLPDVEEKMKALEDENKRLRESLANIRTLIDTELAY